MIDPRQIERIDRDFNWHFLAAILTLVAVATLPAIFAPQTRRPRRHFDELNPRTIARAAAIAQTPIDRNF